MLSELWQWLLGIRPAEFAGAGGWHFSFVARYGNYVNLALIVAFAALVYLVVRSYRREGDAPWRAKCAPAAIRILIIVLLFAILLQPAIVLRFTRTLYRDVVVLIDDSLSMSFPDRYQDARKREKLAGALGVNVDELGRIPRSEIVRRLLARRNGPLAELAKDHPLVLMGFSTARPGTEPYTQKLLDLPVAVASRTGGQDASATTVPAQPPPGGEADSRFGPALAALGADGFETKISAAIRDALDKTQGRRIAGIVVVSDGQITADGVGNERLSSALKFARQSNVPLYAVSVGDPTPAKNLTVAALQAPREVRKDSVAEFTVVLTHRNLDGSSATVRLQQRPAEGDKGRWKDTGAGKSVVLRSGDRSGGLQTVGLLLTMAKVGRLAYRAVVDPIEGEDNPQDNAAEAVVTVSEDSIRILLISGDAGWEFQYLRNFLLRQPELYRTSIWQQNADPDVNQAASTGMKLKALPRTAGELIGVRGDKTKPGYDVVVLYDPQETRNGFDTTFVELLEKFVAEHGGGVCYIAGNKYTQAVLPGRRRLKPLADLLPVVMAPNTINLAERISHARPVAWPVRLTSYGLEHPVTRLGGTDQDTRRVWEVLPGLYWSHPVHRVKPGARVLAVSSNPMRRTADGRLLPLVAGQSVGSGRVLYVGAEATWRWRYVQEGYYHRRFWARVMRYLSGLRARRVVISTGGEQFSAGEKITIEVKAYDKLYNPLTDKTFLVDMIDTRTGAAESIELPAVDPVGKPGRYKRTIVARRTGTFEITARGTGLSPVEGGAGEAPVSRRIVIELPQVEARRREANLRIMKTIASRRQNFMTADEIDKLAGLIPAGRLKTTHEVPHDLWDCPLVLIVIVLLMAAEWILRKKHNMA